MRDDDRHRGFGVVGEVVAQFVANLVRGRRARQRAIIGETPFDVQERKTKEHQEGDARQPDWDRPAQNDDAVLRWNACARQLMELPVPVPDVEEPEPLQSE